MKTKLFTVIIAIIMVVTFTGCTATNVNNNKVDNDVAKTVTQSKMTEMQTEVVTEVVTETVTNEKGEPETVIKTVEKVVPKSTVNNKSNDTKTNGYTVSTTTKSTTRAKTVSNNKDVDNGKIIATTSVAKTVNTTAKATVAKATTKKPAQTVAKTAAKPATTKHAHTWKKVQTNEGDMVKVEYDTIVSRETSGDGFRMYGKVIDANPHTIQCVWVKIDRVLQDGWEGTIWTPKTYNSYGQVSSYYCAEKNKTINCDNGKTQYKAEPAEPVYEWHCTTCGKISKTEP